MEQVVVFVVVDDDDDDVYTPVFCIVLIITCNQHGVSSENFVAVKGCGRINFSPSF
jgi:hypothetical protein